MHDDDGLFADPRPTPPARPPTATNGLADWQVAQLRELIAVSGAHSMSERQQLVEEIVGHPVSSLRELSVPEGRTVMETLAARSQPADGVASAWDGRNEDTWIDRL